MQITIYKTDKQQCPTVKQRHYIQCPVINHIGKEYENDCIHIYICKYITESLC